MFLNLYSEAVANYCQNICILAEELSCQLILFFGNVNTGGWGVANE